MIVGNFITVMCINIVLLLVSGNSVAQQRKNHTLELTESSGQQVRFNYKLQSLTIDTIALADGYYAQYKFDQAGYTNIKGDPALPFLVSNLQVPNEHVTVTVDSISYKELKTLPVISGRGKTTRNRLRTVDHTFSPLYQKDTLLNQTSVEIGDSYVIRGVKGVPVIVRPVSYNPGKGIIRVITHLDFTVNLGPGGMGKRATPNKSSREFQEIIRNHFVNSQSSGYLGKSSARLEPEKMLVITTREYAPAIEPLIDWKNQKGILTTVALYPDSTGTGDRRVKSFITEKYVQDRITYVLIVGDHDDVPAGRGTKMDARGKLSDPQYSLIDGDDYYPDVFVGRFSANSVEDVGIIVHKNIQYEKYPQENGQWYTQGLAFASRDTAFNDIVDSRTILNTLSAGGYSSKQFVEEDDDHAANYTVEKVITEVENGLGTIFFFGHGDTTYWANYPEVFDTDINKISNVNKTPFVISVACANGIFDMSKDRLCFAETWQRKGSLTSAQGSIVYLGASIYIDGIAPVPAAKKMASLLVDTLISSAGAIINYGKIDMVTIDKDFGEETFEAWNTFGDPSISIFSDSPSPLTARHPMTASGEPIVISEVEKGALVCLYSKELNVQQVQLSNGVPMTFSGIDADSGAITVTITKKNRVPYIRTIPVYGNGGVAYSGTPVSLPGTILAVEYDKGGEGVSYHDTSPANRGVQRGIEFRQHENVDINNHPDSGYVIGWIDAGEWVEYTVDVSKAAEYELEIHTSSLNGGGKIGIDVNGHSMLSELAVPQTDDWNNYMIVTENVYLNEGEQVWRINMENGGFNLHKIIVKPYETTELNDKDSYSPKTTLHLLPHTPASKLFYLSREANWSVYSLQGALLKGGKGTLIDMRSFSKGVYLIKFETKAERLMLR